MFWWWNKREEKITLKFMSGIFFVSVSAGHREGQAFEFIKLGKESVEKGLLNEAVVYLNKALAIEQREDVLNLMGVILGLKGKYRESLKRFKSVLELRWNHQEAQYNCARALFLTTCDSSAMSMLVELLENNREIPKELDAHVNNLMGCIYGDDCEYEDAMELFNTAIETDETFVAPYVNYANVYYELDEYDLAETYYKKALELDEACIDAYNGLGAIAYKRKDVKKAEEYFDKAILLGKADYLSYNKKLLVKLRKSVM